MNFLEIDEGISLTKDLLLHKEIIGNNMNFSLLVQKKSDYHSTVDKAISTYDQKVSDYKTYLMNQKTRTIL